MPVAGSGRWASASVGLRVVSEPPISHAQHAPRGGGDFRRVRGEKDGDTRLAVHVAEQRQHTSTVLRVQISCGLIRNQQRRLVHERTGDGRALHLAAGHLLGVVAQPVPDANAVRHALDARLRVPGPHAAEQAGQGDVVREAERRQQVEELKHEADALPSQSRQLIVGQRGEIVSFECDAASRRTIHRAAQVQERRFAAARGSHESDEIASLDRHGDTGKRRDGCLVRDVALLKISGDEQ
jgi:hypothetical protein